MGMKKLDYAEIARLAALPTCGFKDADAIERHQVAVYVMCGGGFLGRFAAEQPADFYIDGRVSGLPYGKRAIEQAVKTLATIAKAAGFDPHHMPQMGTFHNCGIF